MMLRAARCGCARRLRAHASVQWPRQLNHVRHARPCACAQGKLWNEGKAKVLTAGNEILGDGPWYANGDTFTGAGANPGPRVWAGLRFLTPERMFPVFLFYGLRTGIPWSTVFCQRE